jgi:YHS domain-containing protein
MTMSRFAKFASPAVIVISIALAAAADDKVKTGESKPDPTADQLRSASQEALGELNALIGGWRGTGQPVRSSTKGSWTESAEWVWEIKKDHVGIRYLVTGGKLLANALVTWDPEKKKYLLEATLPDKSTRDYAGTLAGNKLTFESPAEAGEDVHQIVVTLLREDRTLVLFQIRKKDQTQFTRVAEVGYTREGTRLADENAGGPECIVTGGKGTMSTVYKGKTYWFCCTGCRDAFNDDPDAIIAQADEKAKKKKAEAAKKGNKEKS